MSIAAHHDAPECPACSAPCGTKNGESIAPGDLRCASCGDDWTATDAELAKAGAADAAWETEQRRQDIMKHERPTETAALQLKLLALVFALAWAMLACTPIQAARSLKAVAAGACIAGTAADLAGEPWGAVLEAISCAIERHAARRAERIDGRELADASDIAVAELEHARDECDPEPTPEQRARVEAALVECERLEGTP